MTDTQARVVNAATAVVDTLPTVGFNMLATSRELEDHDEKRLTALAELCEAVKALRAEPDNKPLAPKSVDA